MVAIVEVRTIELSLSGEKLQVTVVRREVASDLVSEMLVVFGLFADCCLFSRASYISFLLHAHHFCLKFRCRGRYR